MVQINSGLVIGFFMIIILEKKDNTLQPYRGKEGIMDSTGKMVTPSHRYCK